MFSAALLALVCAGALRCSFSIAAELRITARSAVDFASVAQGRAILGRVDEYVRGMNAFDRKLRLDREDALGEADYLNFIQSQVTAWPAEEQQHVAAVVEKLSARLQGLDLPLPPRVLLIRTTGAGEEGDAYTRANAIVLPARNSGAVPEKLLDLLAHELFHLMTRRDPAFRERAYALIGFRLSPQIALPAALAERRIGNPDAPGLDTYVELTVNERPLLAAPVLLAGEDFSLQVGVELSDYWQLRFLAVEPDGRGGVQPVVAEGSPVLYALHEVGGFFERVGTNTSYLIHPEEILADNFALMVAGGRVNDPQRLEQLRALFQRAPR
jgi:hypothetical protein